MKTSCLGLTDSAMGSRPGEQARVRVVLLVLACFLVGLAGGAWMVYRLAEPRGPSSGPSGADKALSESTRAILRRLDSPVTIRFYSLLDPASVPASLTEFAGRVNRLLSEYEREANGKIQVTRYNSQSYATAAAAAADGLKALTVAQGEACYLGIAVAHDGQKESLAQLSPEWEQALEPDLSRVIARVAGGKPSAGPPAPPPQTDAAAVEEVKRAIPDPASVSLEEGTRILREKALTEFAATTQEMEAKVKQAEQRLEQARTDRSQAAEEAARKEMQQIRADQTEKLKQVAARLQAQTTAFEQLKKK